MHHMVGVATAHVTLCVCGLLVFTSAAVLVTIRRRRAERWLPNYLRTRHARRAVSPGEPVHLLLCIADHFEPRNGPVGAAIAQQRLAVWEKFYPAQLGSFRDADGRPPQHTFFYPLEDYHTNEMEVIAGLCRQGYGEVEVHLHHDHESAESLRRRLSDYRDLLATEYGLLARDRASGRLAYGFVHGDWALDNSLRSGRACGVDNELQILIDTGCYADFTLPSAPSGAQTRRINSIYRAREDGRANSHDRDFWPAGGERPKNSLLLVQGPLLLDWNRRLRGVVPRVENACIQASQVPSMQRLDLWLRARVQVPQRPDWFFVKLHTHGAPEANADVLLGDPGIRFHRELAERAMRDSEFHFHYVSAREMYNLVRAAEDGWTGSVADVRDYELVWNSSR